MTIAASLSHAERRLRFFTQAIFLTAIIAVVVDLAFPRNWLLLFTAAAPAFAAALHGTVTRLGIVHRAALSIEVKRELARINKALSKLIDSPPALPRVDDAWRAARRLAFEAAEAMGRENTSWHGLVRRYKDELP